MINVDISNIWSQASLPDLLALEAQVSEAHKALTGGTGAGNGSHGWLELPVTEPAEETARIMAAAGKIRGESDVLVVVGIGGAYSGARAAIELLQGPNRNLGRGKGDPQILFAGNSLSTRHWNELLRLLEGRDFSLCVICGSGDDLEPAIALRNLKWLLERRYGTDEARKRIYAVTDAADGALRRMAGEEGWESFSIPGNVDGSFSVLTPAGLLPMAAAGIDIMELLRGAHEARERYDLRSFENPVWLYAAVRNLMYRSGNAIELLVSYEPGFRMMGAWWQQLFSASEGRDGKGLFPAAAEFTADLQGLGQMVREGRRNLFETMLRFDPPGQKMVIMGDVKDSDGLNYLEGKTLDFVDEQAHLGAVSAHSDGGVPIISIDCGGLDERKLGELFWFFQLSCGISAYVLGVDPSGQPGPALCRQEMFRLLGRPGCGDE